MVGRAMSKRISRSTATPSTTWTAFSPRSSAASSRRPGAATSMPSTTCSVAALERRKGGGPSVAQLRSLSERAGLYGDHPIPRGQDPALPSLERRLRTRRSGVGPSRRRADSFRHARRNHSDPWPGWTSGRRRGRVGTIVTSERKLPPLSTDSGTPLLKWQLTSRVCHSRRNCVPCRLRAR